MTFSAVDFVSYPRSANPADVACHDRLVELVQTMLDLQRQLSSPGSEHERTLLARRIEATDRQIDRLVYELYGLTEEEIGLVEAGLNFRADS